MHVHFQKTTTSDVVNLKAQWVFRLCFTIIWYL